MPGLIYSFRVRAENVNGVGDPSAAGATKNLLESLENSNKLQKADKIAPFSKKQRGSIGLPEKPIILSDAHDIRYYIEGEPAVVTMQIFGYPDPKVKWMRNNAELFSDLVTYKISTISR